MAKMSLKKKMFSFFLIVLLFANIIAAIFIFSDIQIIQSPVTNVEIKIIGFNEKDITLDIEIEMQNPNSFDLSLQDFKIISKTVDGDKIAELEIEGGIIYSKDTKNFNLTDKIKFMEDSDFKILYNQITGTIAVSFLGFIKKSIPVELNIETSIEQLIQNIKVPELDLEFTFDELNPEGLDFTAGISIYNPNDIGITINELTLNAINDMDEEVGSFSIKGGVIKPQNSSYFKSKGVLLYTFIDTKTLILSLVGDASLKIAGMNKSIAVSTEISVLLPDIQEFIFENESVKFYIPVQFRFTLRGLLANIGFKYYNPSNITLIARDIYCSMHRVDGDSKNQLGIEEMENCIIDPHQEVCLETEILIPYISYLRAGNWRFLPDWIVLTIDGDFAIAGTRQAFPISLNAYVNPNLFKNNEFTE